MPATRHPIKVVNAVCPIRINDLGGWTDTWFAEHGEVLNMGVYPYVQCQMLMLPRGETGERVTINAVNYDERYAIDPDNIIYEKHPMLEAAVDMIRLPADLAIEVSIMSSVPGGCSTGTSASVSVALLGALDRATYGRWTPAEVAVKAQEIETVNLGQQCGIQDQLAAAYGGILHMKIQQVPYPEARRPEIARYVGEARASTMKHPLTQVSYLEISNHLRWEIETRTALIYLGETHRSSEVHEMVIRDMEGGGPENPSLRKLRAMAQRAKNAIYESDLRDLGRTMIDNTEAQRELHAGLISPLADSTIEIARRHGAIGWKVNGAGGDGGSLTILGKPDWGAMRRMVREIEEQGRGVREIPTYLSRTGLRVWETPPGELARD